MQSPIASAFVLLALPLTAAAQTANRPTPPGNLVTQFVQLQATSPGTAQVGNVNVTGTVIGGTFDGNGSALTGLNASAIASGTLADARLSSNVAKLNGAQTFTGTKTFSAVARFTAPGAAFTVDNTTRIDNLNCDLLDGLDSSSFLQSIPNPLVVNSATGFAITGGTAVSGYSGVYGTSSDPTWAYGVAGYSAAGAGVFGFAQANIGVYGEVVAGNGVEGYSPNGSGVRGTTGGGGNGVLGTSYTTDSAVAGTNAYGGAGVEGIATGGSNGVMGRSDYPYAAGSGVYGEHNGFQYGVAGRSTVDSPFGSDVGVWGETYGTSGWAMYANGRMYVNGNHYVAGAKVGCVTDIVKNGGGEPLDTGDLVEIMGADEPVLGELPVIVVRKASSANPTAVLGPIHSAVKLVENRMHPPPASDAAALGHGPALPRLQIIDVAGAIAPGGYGHVVTLGAFKSVQVDAGYGPIRPGDLLVASPTPGCAMAAHEAGAGTVIGKSLGSLDSGTGSVPVIVGPR